MRSLTLTTTIALVSLAASTIPSTVAHPQQPTFRTSPQCASPSWRTYADRLYETVFGSPQRSAYSPPSRSKSTDRQAPTRTLARYGGDLVLRFNLTTADEAASLAEAVDTLLLDVWEFSRDWVDIRVAKDVVPSLLGLLPSSLQHAHRPLLSERDLALAIYDTYPASQAASLPDPVHLSPPPTARRPFSPSLDSQQQLSSHPSGAESNLFFADYQPFSVIEPWIRLMASLFTTHVRLINIGSTYEGRNIPALRVGVHPTNDDDPSPPKRKTVVIAGALHAREWISTSTVNYIAWALITGYGKQAGVTQLLEAFDFVFIPTMNPDGYIHTWEYDRLWRKNRQQTSIRFCHGIDLDRSFGFEWAASSNPCSESFSGEEPFEAVEAQRLATWAQNQTANNNVDFVAFLDLHSYSQQILYPFSYSCDDTPPGLENLEELALGLSKAIRNTHGHAYEVLPACEGNVVSSSSRRVVTPRIEPSGGSALDFFHHTLATRYSYQIKLRDRGTYGFLLPKEHIIPTGKEVLNAVLYLGEFLREVYNSEQNQQSDSPRKPADAVKFTKPDLDRLSEEVPKSQSSFSDLPLESPPSTDKHMLHQWELRHRA